MESEIGSMNPSLNQNSKEQKQSAIESTSKHVGQQRPSVLRKGNQLFSPGPACGFQECLVNTLVQTEPNINTSNVVPTQSSQAEGKLATHGACSQTAGTENRGGVTTEVLSVKGHCRWPGCTTNNEVVQKYGHFFQHLFNMHAAEDKGIVQLRIQTNKVKHMENQLIAEKQKLQAMQLYVLDDRTTSEGGKSEEHLRNVSGLLQQDEHRNVAGLCEPEKVAIDALTQGYWQLSVSQVIPGVIPGLEYYRLTNARPPLTYASMIRWAILEAPENQRTLNEIYQWFTSMFYYFRHNTATWKNAVRHNLSLHKCFVRLEGKKGSVWKVDEAEFLRRKVQKSHRDHEMEWMAPFQL